VGHDWDIGTKEGGRIMDTEELLAQRKKEGKEIARMCRLIALEAGERYPKKHGANMVFGHNGLWITQDTYENNLRVTYKTEWVLSIHSGAIKRYIKGEWVKLVKPLYAPLAAAKKVREEQEAKQKGIDRLAAFGIVKEGAE